MTVDWKRVAFYARKVVALLIGGVGAFVFYMTLFGAFGSDYHAICIALMFSCALLLMALGVWDFPNRSRILAASLVGLPLSFPLGEVVGALLFAPAKLSPSLLTNWFHIGGFLWFAVSAALAYWLVTAKSKQPVDPLAPSVPQSGPSGWTRITQQRTAISRGSYLAAGLWLLTLLFVMVDSGAFIGDGPYLGAFLFYFAFPIAVLFGADWLLGKRWKAS